MNKNQTMSIVGLVALLVTILLIVFGLRGSKS